MSILFSRQCEYALQAVMYLSMKRNGHLVPIRELTDKLNIPYYFLAKILQDLTHKGLLLSQKGPTGGFKLALPAAKITLFHIVEAIDGKGFTQNCILGFEECSGTNPCALHEQWSTSRNGIAQMLTGKTIAEMAHRTRKSELHKK